VLKNSLGRERALFRLSGQTFEITIKQSLPSRCLFTSLHQPDYLWLEGLGIFDFRFAILDWIMTQEHLLISDFKA
jgi:hypothetical protein